MVEGRGFSVEGRGFSVLDTSLASCLLLLTSYFLPLTAPGHNRFRPTDGI